MTILQAGAILSIAPALLLFHPWFTRNAYTRESKPDAIREGIAIVIRGNWLNWPQ